MVISDTVQIKSNQCCTPFKVEVQNDSGDFLAVLMSLQASYGMNDEGLEVKSFDESLFNTDFTALKTADMESEAENKIFLAKPEVLNIQQLMEALKELKSSIGSSLIFLKDTQNQMLQSEDTEEIKTNVVSSEMWVETLKTLEKLTVELEALKTTRHTSSDDAKKLAVLVDKAVKLLGALKIVADNTAYQGRAEEIADEIVANEVNVLNKLNSILEEIISKYAKAEKQNVISREDASQKPIQSNALFEMQNSKPREHMATNSDVQNLKTKTVLEQRAIVQKETAAFNMNNSSGVQITAKSNQDTINLNQLASRILDTAENLFIKRQDNTTIMRLKLYPDHLGEVTVRITYKSGSMLKDTNLNVQFYVSNAIAKDAVENILPQLRESLQMKNFDSFVFYNGYGNKDSGEHTKNTSRGHRYKMDEKEHVEILKSQDIKSISTQNYSSTVINRFV